MRKNKEDFIGPIIEYPSETVSPKVTSIAQVSEEQKVVIEKEIENLLSLPPKDFGFIRMNQAVSGIINLLGGTKIEDEFGERYESESFSNPTSWFNIKVVKGSVKREREIIMFAAVSFCGKDDVMNLLRQSIVYTKSSRDPSKYKIESITGSAVSFFKIPEHLKDPGLEIFPTGDRMYPRPIDPEQAQSDGISTAFKACRNSQIAKKMVA